MTVPRTSDQDGNQIKGSSLMKNTIKSEFRTKIVVNDDCITVEGEGAPTIVGLFRGSSDRVSFASKYECDLVDLALILLQQVYLLSRSLRTTTLHLSVFQMFRAIITRLLYFLSV